MVDESNLPQRLEKQNVKGKIEFQNIVFQYDNNPKPTINGFSAIAMPRTKNCDCRANRSWKNNISKSSYEIL